MAGLHEEYCIPAATASKSLTERCYRIVSTVLYVNFTCYCGIAWPAARRRSNQSEKTSTHRGGAELRHAEKDKEKKLACVGWPRRLPAGGARRGRRTRSKKAADESSQPTRKLLWSGKLRRSANGGVGFRPTTPAYLPTFAIARRLPMPAWRPAPPGSLLTSNCIL